MSVSEQVQHPVDSAKSTFRTTDPCYSCGFKGQGILIIFVLLKRHISAKIQYLITSKPKMVISARV